jgi:hypothetical protein
LLQDATDFTYTTPRVIDLEGNLIKVEFKGLEKLPCATVGLNSDNTVTVIVRRSEVKALQRGSYMLMMSVKDELFPWSRNATFATIAISLNYTVEWSPPLEEKIAPKNLDKQNSSANSTSNQQSDKIEQEKLQAAIAELKAEYADS